MEGWQQLQAILHSTNSSGWSDFESRRRIPAAVRYLGKYEGRFLLKIYSFNDPDFQGTLLDVEPLCTLLKLPPPKRWDKTTTTAMNVTIPAPRSSE